MYELAVFGALLLVGFDIVNGNDTGCEKGVMIAFVSRMGLCLLIFSRHTVVVPIFEEERCLDI